MTNYANLFMSPCTGIFLSSTFKNLTLKVGKIKEIIVKNFLRLDFFWV